MCAYCHLLGGTVQREGKRRAAFGASRLTAMLDMLDDQHLIAASLKFVRYALDLYAEAVARKMFAHEMEVRR
jgi:hypothetical protein